MSVKHRQTRALTHSDVIKLNQLMQNDKELIAKQKYTAQQYAVRASQVLGFVVSEHSIKRLQDTSGVSFDKPRISPLAQTYVDLKRRVEELEKQMQSLKDQLNF